MILVSFVFIILLLIGAPIAFAFAFSSFIYIWTTSSLSGDNIAAVFYSALDSFPLMAIPFFIFAGDLMVQGGISKKIIEFIRSMIGSIKGYLGTITIISSVFFSAVSGSAVATVAAVGSMMLPEMNRANYPKGYSASLVATSAFLGFIIPPSIPMVMYGFLTNTSISGLFIAGILPGFLFALFLLIMHFLLVRNMDIEQRNIETNANDSQEVKVQEKILLQIFRTGRLAILALLMPVIVIGGIYAGIFTPTESAVVAVFYSLLVGTLFYRQINFGSFYTVAKKSALNTAMIMITLVFATIFSRILTIEKVPEKLATVILNISEQTWIIILIIIVFLLLVGMVMDAITGVILVTPILYPIGIMQLGMDPIHFGIVMIIALAIGMITPPMAMNIFLAAKIGGASVKETFRYNIPYLILSIGFLLLIAYVPSITISLVSLINS